MKNTTTECPAQKMNASRPDESPQILQLQRAAGQLRFPAAKCIETAAKCNIAAEVIIYTIGIHRKRTT